MTGPENFRYLWSDIRNQFLDPFHIRGFDVLGFPENPFAAGCFLGQNVPGKGPFRLDLPGSRLLKSFCRSSVRLDLWHNLLL